MRFSNVCLFDFFICSPASASSVYISVFILKCACNQMGVLQSSNCCMIWCYCAVKLCWLIVFLTEFPSLFLSAPFCLKEPIKQKKQTKILWEEHLLLSEAAFAMGSSLLITWWWWWQVIVILKWCQLIVIPGESKVRIDVWKKNMIYSTFIAFSNISNNRVRKSSLCLSR